jgi:hypothetical protein
MRLEMRIVMPFRTFCAQAASSATCPNNIQISTSNITFADGVRKTHRKCVGHETGLDRMCQNHGVGGQYANRYKEDLFYLVSPACLLNAGLVTMF